MRDFLTFALTSVRHSVVHRPKIGEHVKADEGKKKESRGKLVHLRNQSGQIMEVCALTAGSPKGGFLVALR